MPALIKLTRSTSRVQLRETWDLIYPGAKTFYGHGYIVDYDLDWLSVRAGWALESLTFQNFGFSEGVIDHDTMFKSTIEGKADKPLQDVVHLKRDPVVQRKLREMASDRANDWWKEQGPSWSRQNALIEALAGQDPMLAERAMNWVRNGTTRCDGFSRRFIKSRVLPLSSNILAPELAELRNWLLDMEREKKDDYFYKTRNESACF